MGLFKPKEGTIVATKPNKAFTWSWSRVKNYEVCPRRYNAIDVTKEFKQEKTEQLDEGDRLHKAMALRVSADTPLPREFYYMERHAETLTAITHPLQIVNTELKLAISKDHKPVGFFDRDVWARCVVDYLKIVPSNNYSLAHIVDYKTGKLVEDDAQLVVNAMLVFGCFKDVVGIKTEFLWCKYNDSRSLTLTRKSIQPLWGNLMPRISKLEGAHINNEFPAKPNRFCEKWCNVESCEYYGEAR